MGRKKSGRSGASMMEIMIALVIVAALSAMAIPNLQMAARKKKADRALAALMAISECVKQHKIEYRLDDNPNITFATLRASGCFSSDDLPPDFKFGDLMADTIPNPAGGPVAVESTDGYRTVCVTEIGNLDASRAVYFIDGPGPNEPNTLTRANCSSAYTDYYRRISEDQIGKQRGY